MGLSLEPCLDVLEAAKIEVVKSNMIVEKSCC